jgi:hypothetical protein
LHGKIGANMKSIMLSAFNKDTITVNIGELLYQEIQDANFMSALKGRYHTIKYF